MSALASLPTTPHDASLRPGDPAMAFARHSQLAAWLIVLLCLALAVSFSARTSIGLVLDPIEKELGWDRTFTSGGYVISAVVMAIMSPTAGNMVDRFGARLLRTSCC